MLPLSFNHLGIAVSVRSTRVWISHCTMSRDEAIMLKYLPIMLFHYAPDFDQLFPQYFRLFSNFITESLSQHKLTIAQGLSHAKKKCSSDVKYDVK